MDADLQEDFSLHHALSLYLLDTLREARSRALETYALDVLTLVESILENPDVVLCAAARQAQGREGRRAQGRRASSTRSAWRSSRSSSTRSRTATSSTTPSTSSRGSTRGSARRTSARSRSRATCSRAAASFHDYVRDYGLQRSEGVLLRYLSEVYKTLVQTVPEGDRTDEVDDVIAFLRRDRAHRRLEPARRVGGAPEPGLRPARARRAVAPGRARSIPRRTRRSSRRGFAPSCTGCSPRSRGRTTKRRCSRSATRAARGPPTRSRRSSRRTGRSTRRSTSLPPRDAPTSR